MARNRNNMEPITQPLQRAGDSPEAALLGEMRALERLINYQIEQLRGQREDHEKRLRLLEETATRFNFILYLTMGGGLVSLMNLFAIINVLVRGGK